MTKPWPKWLRFLMLGLLVWLEEKWIETHVTKTVDEAIKEYETLHIDPIKDSSDPVYSETGDGFFDEMRLTAPWKGQDTASDSPQV